MPIFTKILPVGAELFLADIVADMTKLLVAFQKSANAPKEERVMTGLWKYDHKWLSHMQRRSGFEPRTLRRSTRVVRRQMVNVGYYK
jgi:hypothetical protein